MDCEKHNMKVLAVGVYFYRWKCKSCDYVLVASKPWFRSMMLNGAKERTVQPMFRTISNHVPYQRKSA